jgi:trehalose/maltose hydrolase-like predicted phosphorylase
MASLAGTWTALVAGFGGLRDDGHILSLDHKLPEGISRLKFGLYWRKYRLVAEVDHREVTYTLRDGPDGQLTIRHAGDELTLTARNPSTVALRTRRALLPNNRPDAPRAGISNARSLSLRC